MKKISLILCCAVGAAIVAACGGTIGEGHQPKNIEKAELDSASFMMGYSFGMQMKQSNVGPLTTAEVLKGIEAAADGQEIDYSEFQRIVSSFLEKRNAGIGEEMATASAKFLEQKKHEEGVIESGTGLLYKIVYPGVGAHPAPLDTVEVDYEGKNLAGKVFDSTYERGVPATFCLYNVIKGWSEGIQLIGEEGIIELYIPAELAYGDRQMGADIAPNEALTFTVELHNINRYQEPILK